MSKESKIGRRISRREFLGVAAAGAGVVFLGACGGGQGGGGGGGESYRLTLIVGVTGDEFYTTMECGAQAAAQELGVELDVQGPEEFSAAEQTPILNAAIQAKPDAILIAPTDVTAMVAPIQSAVNQDITVVLVDTTIEKEEIALAQISSDNVKGRHDGGRGPGQADRRRGQGHGHQRQARHLDHRPEATGLRGGDKEVPEHRVPWDRVLQRRSDPGGVHHHLDPPVNPGPQRHLRRQPLLRARRRNGTPAGGQKRCR